MDAGVPRQSRSLNGRATGSRGSCAPRSSPAKLAAGTTLPERLSRATASQPDTGPRSADHPAERRASWSWCPTGALRCARSPPTNSRVCASARTVGVPRRTAGRRTRHVEQLDAMEDAQTRSRVGARGYGRSDQAWRILRFTPLSAMRPAARSLRPWSARVLAFTVSFRADYRYPDERSETALVEHDAIFAAIGDRDGDLAERLMRDHVASSSPSPWPSSITPDFDH